MKPGDEFRAGLRRQAIEARRAMVRSGELVSAAVFRERLGVNTRRLVDLETTGSIFSIEVDGEPFFPALLTDASLDQRRLRSVCRILVPAPPAARLDYLTSRQGNLGGLTPLLTLSSEKSYRHMRSMARAYAASWSRTAVTIYRGIHQRPPANEEPMMTAAEEADPRTNVWKRAASAFETPGYVHSDAPYPQSELATLFISRDVGGGKPVVIEARIEIRVHDTLANAWFFCDGVPDFDFVTIAVQASASIAAVVSQIILVLPKDH